MEFKSELIPPVPAEPVVRVVVEVTRDKAEALAKVLDEEITWATTPVEEELAALYAALRYHRVSSS